MKSIYILPVVLILILSCSKEKSGLCGSCVVDECTSPAIVIEAEDIPAVNGCNGHWHVQAFGCQNGAVDIVDYVAENLPDSFQVDSLAVNVTFSVLDDSALCGAFRFPKINIITISRR